MQSPLETGPAVIGLDEAGKGDYFGPLVVAAVAGSPAALRAVGATDSKKVSDARAQTLAALIRAGFAVEVVAINPPRYNELYGRMRNLNKLLAWCHAQALENLLARVTVEQVWVDQFAGEHVLQQALKERGKAIRLVQVHRGEAHAVVAAASLVARAEFLTRLAALGERWQIKLHKGAGAPVDAAGREIVASGGEELLQQVAKWHFKNTEKIRALV